MAGFIWKKSPYDFMPELFNRVRFLVWAADYTSNVVVQKTGLAFVFEYLHAIADIILV